MNYSDSSFIYGAFSYNGKQLHVHVEVLLICILYPEVYVITTNTYVSDVYTWSLKANL